MNRRQAISLAIASSLVTGTSVANARSFLQKIDKTAIEKWPQPPVNIIIPSIYDSLPRGKRTTSRFERQLTDATLDFLFTWYSQGNVPVWQKKISEIPFQEQIPLIVHYVLQSVEKQSQVYPVDPVWIIAQIMTESFFCDKAISTSLAVGLCQFITPTAREYDLLCATDKPEHFKPPYRKTEFAGEEKKFLEARAKLKALRQKYSSLFSRPMGVVKELLLTKQTSKQKKKMREYAQALKQAGQLQEQIAASRKKYQEYLQANITDKNVLNPKDAADLNAFDQRTTLQAPIDSMVLMMARHLHHRSGNIIAATAGYNAGLKTTEVTYGAGKAYGRLPAIQETVDYVNRIFIRHHELIKRMSR